MAAADIGARFVRGEHVFMMNYTPTGGDVPAGTLVEIGNKIGIAHSRIKDDELGALAMDGGEYESNLFDEEADVGDDVFWNGTGIDKDDGGIYLGFVTQAAEGASGPLTGRFYHRPASPDSIGSA